MTPSIHDQLAWEQRMVDRGVERFRKQQDNATGGDRAHESSAGSRLLRSYVLQVSDHIRLYLDGKHPEGRRRSQYAKLLNTLNTDKTALFALKAVIGSLFRPMTTQSLCIRIGSEIEDELRFSKFQAEHKEYYDEIIRQFESRNSNNYRYKRRALNHVSTRNEEFDWQPWSKEVSLKVGALVVSLLLESCDLVTTERVSRGKGQHDVFVVPTQDCIEWVTRHNEGMELMSPDRMPCIVPPADWISPTDGGYYSPQLRRRNRLVKIRGGENSPQQRMLEEADMPTVYNGLNAMQRTGWQVNTAVLDVMKEIWHKNLGAGMPASQPLQMPPCPLPENTKASDLPENDPMREAFVNWKAEAREVHSMEKERVSQNLAVSRTIRIAGEMQQYDKFYFVYTCDFRGRVYCTTNGLSPQGTDHSKALLQFDEAKPLGERGLFWLKVHGAGKWGEDKSSNAERVAWIEDRHETWVRCAQDPIGTRSIWSEADKPYQFLAFCFEYEAASRVGTSFRSRLPIALDGTCNGLQHFSAMLRDEVGGAAVNLIPGNKPSDIYAEVGAVATRKLHGLSLLQDEDNGGAINWLALFAREGNGGMPRKIPKPPVMTRPYGSTRQACTSSTFRWISKYAPDYFPERTGFRHALYLTPVLWDAINEVIVSSKLAMDWLQKCASALSKEGHPIVYVSPLGFPMYQAAYKYEIKRIETQIGGRLQLRFGQDTSKLDVNKQRNGISPQTVHCVDASHLLMTVEDAADHGLTSFAMIHDDFGVHACDTDLFQGIIRKQFVKLHGENDILQDFKAQQKARFDIDLPDPPARGDLDIDQVLESEYFFG